MTMQDRLQANKQSSCVFGLSTARFMNLNLLCLGIRFLASSSRNLFDFYFRSREYIDKTSHAYRKKRHWFVAYQAVITLHYFQSIGRVSKVELLICTRLSLNILYSCVTESLMCEKQLFTRPIVQDHKPQHGFHWHCRLWFYFCTLSSLSHGWVCHR